ncbi:MAG: hypothetical protein HYY49_04975 [Ignavibacteriales bacterium]|nr:hypothetical protein [Ignavibacteriales bacterium]
MIEVFRTNVADIAKTAEIIQKLLERYPRGRINFDLEDRDKILRVEAQTIDQNEVISLMNNHGFHCEALPD